MLLTLVTHNYFQQPLKWLLQHLASHCHKINRMCTSYMSFSYTVSTASLYPLLVTSCCDWLSFCTAFQQHNYVCHLQNNNYSLYIILLQYLRLPTKFFFLKPHQIIHIKAVNKAGLMKFKSAYIRKCWGVILYCYCWYNASLQHHTDSSKTTGHLSPQTLLYTWRY